MESHWRVAEVERQELICDHSVSSQGSGFSSGHVWMSELDCKEGWVPKNWCFWNVVLEKTLESPLGSKEIKSVYPKGYQPWIFIGWTAAEAETPILWPPDVKSWLTGKDLGEGEGEVEGEGEGDSRRWDGWMASPTQCTWVWANLEIVKDREACCAAVHGVTKIWTWLSDWTTTKVLLVELWGGLW